MKTIWLLSVALLGMICVQTASAQNVYTSTEYNFRATFPGDVQQVDHPTQFQSYTSDHQFVTVVQFIPLNASEKPATNVPDAGWWQQYEKAVENGAGKSGSTLSLTNCTVGNIEGYPTDFCALTMRNSSGVDLSGRISSVYRYDKEAIYTVAAFYSVGGSYGDANVTAFQQSFSFLQ
jgi:hypothetical protein